MKHQLLWLVLLVLPITATAQPAINPTNIQQPNDIVLQNTDVYYTPFAPPGPMDSRENLCNISTILRDPNGVGDYWESYIPIVWDASLSKYDTLANWAPHGTPLGRYARWQRYFTARDKHDQTLSDRHSNIVAGCAVTDAIGHGPVTISKNEDVDFRASGTIKLESGFHVMPGAFFHAYIEPRWDTLVFGDDFSGSTLDRSKWAVADGPNGGYQDTAWPRCSSDSNVKMVTDLDAHDGHAVDIILREVADTCECYTHEYVWGTGCDGRIASWDSVIHRYLWSTAILRSCPWPWMTEPDSGWNPAYEHSPYGKYEFREKIPHTKHHTNNWGASDFEYDLNETWGGNMNDLHVGIGGPHAYGPFKGTFGRLSPTDTTPVFRSSEPGWCASNQPRRLIINGFAWNIWLGITGADTFLYIPSWEHHQFPTAYLNSGDSFVFYYNRTGDNIADSLPWTVSQDVTGAWRIFSAGYHVRNGDTLRFSKDYQPTSITTKDAFGVDHTRSCRWDFALNSPTDYGLLIVDPPFDSLDSHSGFESYKFTMYEGNSNPSPPVPFDGEDTGSGYAYHTFGMEFMPNEVRILLDSNVVARYPDRLVPRTHRYYNPTASLMRSPVNLFPAEVDIDDPRHDHFGIIDSVSGTNTDLGQPVYWSTAYGERKYFEEHPHNPGFEPVTIGGKPYDAAHHKIDYVKVWDVPSALRIPSFPH